MKMFEIVLAVETLIWNPRVSGHRSHKTYNRRKTFPNLGRKESKVGKFFSPIRVKS